MRTYAYIRVSTADQNEGRQLDSMRALGIPEACIYVDKQRGITFSVLRESPVLKPVA